MKAYTVNPNRYYISHRPGAHRFPNAAQQRLCAEKIVEAALAAMITLSVMAELNMLPGLWFRLLF